MFIVVVQELIWNERFIILTASNDAQPSSLNHDLWFATMYIIFTLLFICMARTDFIITYLYIPIVFYMVSINVTPPWAISGPRAVRPIIISRNMLLFDFSRIIQFCLLHKHTRILLFSSVSEFTHFYYKLTQPARTEPCPVLSLCRKKISKYSWHNIQKTNHRTLQLNNRTGWLMTQLITSKDSFDNRHHIFIPVTTRI